MLGRVLLRRFSTSPFTQDFHGQADYAKPRAIANFSVSREHQQVIFSALAARFQSNERSISIKERGVVMLEFIPKVQSDADPTRKTLNLKEKKLVTIVAEDFYHLVQFKGEYETTRKMKVGPANISFRKKDDSVHLKVEHQQPAAVSEVSLHSQEFFMLQRYLEVSTIQYALPYVLGWYAMGNVHLAEQNLVTPREPSADPFDKI